MTPDTKDALFEFALEQGQMSVWAWELRGRRIEDAAPLHVLAGAAFRSSIGLPVGSENALTWSGMLERTGMIPADRERTTRAVQACIDGETPEFRLEVESVVGTWRVIRGRVAGNTVFGTAMDVTERHHAEERLEMAAQLTQLSAWEFELKEDGLVENSVFASDTAMYSGVNRERRLPPEVGFMRTLEGVGVPLEDRQGFRDAIQDCVDGKTPSYHYEFRTRRVDRVFTWREVMGHVSKRTPEGRPLRVVGAAIDITPRKLAQARMELAIRGSNLGTFELDMPDGQLETSQKTYFNVWESLGGMPADPEAQLTFGAHPDDRASLRNAIQHFLIGSSTQFESEFRVVKMDGSVGWRLARGVVSREDGRPTRFTGTLIDITELREARKAAEAANRAKDEFLANVSHEIRTPMNAILGMTELVLDSPLTGHQSSLLGTVKLAANNLLVIINDLLDFSKIEAGKITLENRDFSLRAVVHESVRALAVRAHRKGLELLADVAEDVPDALVGDAGRLRQVLLNIVGNAIKFTEVGEVAVLVSRAADDAIRFEVRDTGIGIAPGEIERIFRPFEQEDTSTTRRFGGTGLGLSIASQLASLMGGGIAVESSLGGGSLFVVTARFARASAEAAPRVIAPEKGPRVFVSEPNASHRAQLERWLGEWGMEVVTAAPFELALVDGRAEIDVGDARSIALAQTDRASKPGASAYLWKPLARDELLETIGHVMHADANAAPLVRAPKPPIEEGALDVLVAEDNEFSAQFMTELLGAHGHRVTVVPNGRAVLSRLASSRYDLVLLDLHMPELDGFDVARAVREREAREGGHLPIVALTARSRREDRERCLAAGMDDFLPKPVGPADLFAVIRRLVG